jgi:hypothetical protein
MMARPYLYGLTLWQAIVTRATMKTLNPNSRALLLLGVLLAAFPQLISAQNGWQRTTDFPTTGYQFDPVEAGGRIYVAGGFNGTASSNVFFSTINSNASLGSWTTTTPLPEADAGPGVATYNGWIYVALGSGHVFRAAIQPTGDLGNWISEPSVETSMSYDTALKAYKGHLYLFGRFNGNYNNVLRIATINSDGSLATWAVGSLPLALNRMSVQFYNDRVYLAGGITTGNNVIGFSYSAVVRTNGGLSAYRQEADLPVPLWYQGSALINDTIYLFGGATNNNTTSQVNTVYKGVVNPTNGAIASWVLADTMPTSFNTAPGSVFASANGNAYLIGGADLATSQFSNQAWRKALIAGANHPPVANSQSISLSANSSAAVTMTAFDADNDTLAFFVTSLPTNGILSGTPPNLAYQPNTDFSGADSFTFKVNDGQADSPLATISLAVLPVTNHAPIAKISVSPLAQFPGIDELLVIAGSGRNASVSLDASQSTDADNDPLQFQWFDGEDLLASGSDANVTLSVGSHTITLLANDGKATGADEVTLEVISPADAVQLLIALVENSSLPGNRKNPLLASLRAASGSFDRGHSGPGVNQLQAFQHKLSAQVARINPALANEFDDIAQEIIDSLR